MSKPRISVREGLARRRIWVCVSYKLVAVAECGFCGWVPDRIGYGVTPSDAYDEWEAS